MKSHAVPRITRCAARRIAVGVLALSLTLTACGGGSTAAAGDPAEGAGTPVDGGTLVIAEGATAPHLNPYPERAAPGMATLQFLSLMYEPLLAKDDTGDVVAGGTSLSESLEQQDPTTVVVKIRPGVRFHSGAEMTAEDVAFTYTHATDPAIGSPVGQSRLSSLASAVATDAATVTFTLKRPDSGFLPALASDQLPVIERKWTEEHGGDLNTYPNGTGAFKFGSFTPNDSFRAERFEDYWDPALPHLDAVEVKTMADVATRVAAVRTGEADIVEFPWDQGRLIDTLDGVTVASTPPILGEPFFVSCKNAPLEDIRVRQALMHSLDVNAIKAQVGQGMELPPSYVVPPDFPRWGVPVGAENPYPRQDTAKARSLLAEAGHPDGVTIDVEILQSPTFDYNKRTVELAAQQAATAGIHLNVVPVDLATGLAHLADGSQIASQMGMPVNDDPSAYWVSFSPLAPSGCTDSHIQDLIAQEKAALDDDTRAGLIKDIVVYAQEQAFLPMLYARPARLTVIRDGVENYTPVAAIRWNSARETWKSEEAR